MKILAAIVLLVALLSCTPPPAKRVDLELENSTGEKIEVTAECCGFRTDPIRLDVGETWIGYIPRPTENADGSAPRAKIRIRKPKAR